MQINKEPRDTDVPFFPYNIFPSKKEGFYETKNHLVEKSISLNKSAAEILRLANGEKQISDIIIRLADRYPDAGGIASIRSKVVELLIGLTAKELIWWRDKPIKPVAVGPPLNIFWELTAECNLRCLHCVVSAGKKLSKELSTERCLFLAHEMADFGVQGIAFSGGEPLVHKDFRKIAERVKELGLGIQVATNGTLVTSKIAYWLKDLDAEIQVSLDGSNSKIHDYMRPGHEAFKRSIQGIKRLVAAGHEVMIGTVLSNINIKDIPSILRLAEEIGVTHFRLIPFVPKGRGEKHTNIEVSPQDVKNVVQYLHDARSKVRVKIIDLEFEESLYSRPKQDTYVPERGLGCHGAVGYATITPSGELLPCHFFEGVRADNIEKASFREVWERSRFLNYFRNLTISDLHGKCRKCPYISSCAGGCRAVNFSKGDLFGTNRQCWVANEL